MHGLRELTPGQGLWLYVGGAATVGWPRPSSEDSVLHELHAGRNLVGWAGRDGTPIEDAVVRFGDTFVRASLWDASTKRYLHYRPGRESTNPLRELNHGDALWVDLTEDARWWQSGAAPPPVTFLGEFTEERRTEIREWVDGTRRLFAERWGLRRPSQRTSATAKLSRRPIRESGGVTASRHAGTTATRSSSSWTGA